MISSASHSLVFQEERFSPLPLPLNHSHSTSSLVEFIDLRPTSSSISGGNIPDSLVKESMIKMVRSLENNERKINKNKKQFKNNLSSIDNQSLSSLNSNEDIYDDEDLKISNDIDTNDQNQIINTNKIKTNLLSKKFFSNNFDPLLKMKTEEELMKNKNMSLTSSSEDISSKYNYLKLKESSKVSNLLHMNDDYSIKWLKMKEKRDKERQCIENKEKKKDFLVSFNQFINTTEKNNRKNYFNLKNGTEEQQKEWCKTNYYIHKNKKLCKDYNYQQFLNEKKNNVKDIREVLKANKEFVKEFKQRELKELQDSIYNSSDNTNSFVLDSNSSTIIHIPNKLKDNIKNAKSLNSYNKAKEDLKLFHTSILSNRINNHARNKNLAKLKAINTGGTVTVNRLNPLEYFSDSIDSFDLSYNSSSLPQSPSQTNSSFTYPSRNNNS